MPFDAQTGAPTERKPVTNNTVESCDFVVQRTGVEHSLYAGAQIERTPRCSVCVSEHRSTQTGHVYSLARLGGVRHHMVTSCLDRERSCQEIPEMCTSADRSIESERVAVLRRDCKGSKFDLALGS